jgi:Tfp pilus assembly protein PilF
VDDAIADIERAQKLDPKNSDALALQSVIAVTQNEKGKALDLGQKAVAADPKSATARIALSYAQQAHFDLKGALSSLEEAVKLAPGNALAWARLAEMRQSFGYLDKSLDAAKEAAALRPDLSRTQTVLGFSYLTRVETKEAQGAFEKAIKLDDADPLPRLGLGLAKIREGHLEEGRREIEIAMSLDPNNSLIRSYLGKAYYEEKRDKLATGQYEMAKNLDPSDPTPYFYDAIEKQTTNRPVEALHDLEKSIELNDNRAVYRSRLLLDSDLAARSASLGRIYTDLGFQQRALVEGWKSVNTDPSDYSGHRFLADTYAALPRHEIARVSELLLSQLLQPINITPVQPRLAESNLFISSAEGPSSLSFNEFNPMFNRNRIALQASGIVGNNSTFGEEVVVSGIYEKASFSIGQNYFKTDGVRLNNDLRDNLFNAFIQYNLFPRTSIQGEYRYRDNRRGDTELLFWNDNIYPNLDQENKRQSFRLGFLQSFSPQSNLIGNFSYNKNDQDLNYTFFIDPGVIGLPPPDIQDAHHDSANEKAYTGELQHLYRSKYINTIIGAGYFKIDQDLTFREIATWAGEIPPALILEGTDIIDLKISHYNIYLYSHIKPVETLTLTVGASGDFYKADDQNRDDRDLEKNQFNPKFGATWNLLPDTTFRGAVFRTLKRTLVTDQTLEPTQVAGFNQFYDDLNATEAWVYGAAVDQKFSKSLFAGAEYYYRDLEVPFLTQTDQASPFVFQNAGWKENIGRLYLNWTPHQWLALRGGYVYEKFDRDDQYSAGIREVKTHSIPLGISFFHPYGLSAGLNAAYYNQDGEFQNKNDFSFQHGNDNFWVVDTAINYRLPNRYGFVSVGATNLFNEKFNFADTDVNNPRIQPGRNLYCKVTLALP